MRRIPKRLKALPVDIGYSFKALSERVSSAGVNVFAQQIIAGFLTSELKKVRTDQVWTLLANGTFLADLIDENHLPTRWERMMGLIGKFTDLRSIGQRLDYLMTPELVAGAIKEANIEAYGLIINSDAGGPKWFYDQSNYLKAKIIRIIEREAIR